MHVSRPGLARHGAALLLGIASLGAQADVLDFEGMPASLFFSGDSFAIGDFKLSVGGDFAVVDAAASCSGGVCPSGNATQFYQALNDGHVTLARTDSTAFSLLGFDAGFLVADPQFAVGTPGQIRISAVLPGGTTASASLSFAGADGHGGFAFASYSGTSLAAFGAVISVEFSACAFDGIGGCLSPAANPGLYGPAQFGLDNLSVGAPVPEPASALMLALGGLAIAVASRRRTRTSNT